MIGTVRLNLVDGVNRPMLKKGISELSDKDRGAWCLVAAHDGVENLAELKKQHETMGKKKQETKEFVFQFLLD